MTSIKDSDVIVADLTATNPNVMYELGYAHHMSKPVVLITQEIDSLPFDLKSYSTILYGTHFKRVPQFKNELQHRVSGICDGSVPSAGPAHDFLNIPTQVPAETASTDAAPDETGDEPAGFLDNLEAFETFATDGLSRIESMSEIIKKYSETTSQRTLELRRAQVIKGTGSLKSQTKVPRAYARDIDEVTRQLAENRAEYASALEPAEESLARALDWVSRSSDASHDEASKQFRELLPTLEEAVTGVETAIEKGRGLQHILTENAEFNVDTRLTRSMRGLIAEMDEILARFTATGGMFRRALDVIHGFEAGSPTPPPA